MKTVWIKTFWSTKLVPGVDTFDIDLMPKDRAKLVFKMVNGEARVLPVDRWSRREWGVIPCPEVIDAVPEQHGS